MKKLTTIIVSIIIVLSCASCSKKKDYKIVKGEPYFCETCTGTGEVSWDCSLCKGTGKMENFGDVHYTGTCLACEGSTKTTIECTNCDGEGKRAAYYRKYDGGLTEFAYYAD